MKMPSFLTTESGSDRVGHEQVRDVAARVAARRAELAVAYEELLDQVWRCEREWTLDDRIAFACRSHRR